MFRFPTRARESPMIMTFLRAEILVSRGAEATILGKRQYFQAIFAHLHSI